MKSSMPSPRNPNLFLRNDKRVEVLLKQEMTEHKEVISSHHKEMQELRDALKISRERFDSLYGHSDKEMKDMALYFNQQLMDLHKKALANEKRIDDQRQTILSLFQQLHDFHQTYSDKIEMGKLKKDMDSLVNQSTVTQISAFQNLQQELKGLYLSLKEDVSKMKSEMENKFGELTERMENKLNVSKLEKEAVLKEIKVYDKSQFIIEKKIENIYTLIERINKKGEVCHKPES